MKQNTHRWTPLLATWIGLLLATSTVLADDRPNIVFIFSDDHAPHAIGAYDGWLKSVNPTPNIDQLARQGMLFQNSFAPTRFVVPVAP